MRLKFQVTTAAFVAVVFAASASQAQQTQADPRPANNPEQKPAFAGQTDAPEQKLGVAFDVVTVVEGLQNPWSVAFLPNGKMLITERPGRLRVLDKDGKLSAPVTGLPAVFARAQGGLLDVALDPAFATNNLIYWSYSEPRENNENNTAVARGKFVDDPAAPRVDEVQVIYHQRPSMNSPLHFGSRLVFGRDGTLFVTQGERSIIPGRMQAQKLDSGLGKIVRINPDGSIPKDNPWLGRANVSPWVFAHGLKDPEGAAIHPVTGDLWVTDHGPQGGDEIDIVKAGSDYGWPDVSYGRQYDARRTDGAKNVKVGSGLTSRKDVEEPIYYWVPSIGPSGMAFYTGDRFPEWKGNLFIGAMPGQHLVRLVLKDNRVVAEEKLLADRKQRIREVRQGPDGYLYIFMGTDLVRLTPKG